MPLFEVEEAGTLVPFRQLLGGAELYESEIEDLLWSNLEEFTGEALFGSDDNRRLQEVADPTS